MRSVTSPSGARLVAVRVPRRCESVAVVLHGGAARGSAAPVSATQLSVLRMIPIGWHLAWSGRRTAVFRLLNSRRGWDAELTPVADATWALDQARQRVGDRPAALVGHSLGGRAALFAGAHHTVRAVVALNPWVYLHDDPDLEGRDVLVLHGDRDRIASPQRSAAVAQRIAERMAQRAKVEFVTVPGAKHAMLRHGRTFQRQTSRFLHDTLTAR
ncbi:alpha/beta hydrolase [Nocardioides salsibiostraticola]